MTRTAQLGSHTVQKPKTLPRIRDIGRMFGLDVTLRLYSINSYNEERLFTEKMIRDDGFHNGKTIPLFPTSTIEERETDGAK